MRQAEIYLYEGDNGFFTSYVKLNNSQVETKYRLRSDSGKILYNIETKERKTIVDVKEEEIEKWIEEEKKEEDWVQEGIEEFNFIQTEREKTYEEIIDIVTGTRA